MIKLRRSCREVTRLVLAQPEQPLGLLDRVVLQLHWLACNNCRRFRDQTRQLGPAMDRWRRYRDE